MFIFPTPGCISPLKSRDGEAKSLFRKNHLQGIGWGLKIKPFLIVLWKGVTGWAWLLASDQYTLASYELYWF